MLAVSQQQDGGKQANMLAVSQQQDGGGINDLEKDLKKKEDNSVEVNTEEGRLENDLKETQTS